MRKLTILFLVVAVLLMAGCKAVVPPDVVDSIQVLRANTHALSNRYNILLDRSEAVPGEEDESEQAEEQRLLDWEENVKHEKILMNANNTLANKVYKWAEVCREGDGDEDPQ